MNHKLYAWSILEEQEEEQNIREKRNCFSVVFFSIALKQSYARKLKPERDGQGFVTVRSHNSNVHYFPTWRTRAYGEDIYSIAFRNGSFCFKLSSGKPILPLRSEAKFELS